MMSTSRYMSAKGAADALGIALPTLYAYVSRGLIRSEATGERNRTRRYLREDVEKLIERKEQRRNPNKAAEQALDWGAPVLESSITLIDRGSLYYRGYDVIALSRTRTLEEIAGLIWMENFEQGDALFQETQVDLPPNIDFEGLRGLTFLEAFQAVLPLASATDLNAYTLTPGSVARTGARILKLMARTVYPQRDSSPVSEKIAESLKSAWTPENEASVNLINAALILCADHEFNVSAFTVRTVASADSNPYAAVIAGLAALQGAKHGGATDQVAALLREVDAIADPRLAITNRLKRGESIPGFGHRLYPAGDPRGRALLEILEIAFPDHPRVAVSQAIVSEMAALIEKTPNIDFALATLARVLDLPIGAGIAIFALGRTVGWIGHAIEQYALDSLIRPRARYVGKPPMKS